MSWQKLRPIGARVLVVLDKRREFYDHETQLIRIPDDRQKQPETGRVVAIGKDAGDGWRAATWDGSSWRGGTRVFFGKWNGQSCAAPEFDPSGEYYFLIAPRLSDKGKKLPVPNQGHTHLPVIDEIFAILEDDDMTDDDVVTMTARDLPKARFAR